MKTTRLYIFIIFIDSERAHTIEEQPIKHFYVHKIKNCKVEVAKLK